ncbi:MAG: orotidine-5'-phosphate decarboxylase, partial [Candidatus Omnitrophica bacterium]|nr:orotidine-5'-phosphate decarboxylase [Candidatus Omnitrophota bacterium]
MPKLIVALDLPERKTIYQLVEQLDELIDYYKIGPVALTACGFSLIDELLRRRKKIFLDLKFFDIPYVVGETVHQLAELGIELLTLHLLGGQRMVEAAIEGRNRSAGKLRLLGVTVLTSMTEDDWRTTGIELDLKQLVQNLACLGKDWGLDGVVCSP